MGDILTKLEDLMDERYVERRDTLVELSGVEDWADANYRAGYLKAFRDIGLFIRRVRSPELQQETGEIPDIFTEGEGNGAG